MVFFLSASNQLNETVSAFVILSLGLSMLMIIAFEVWLIVKIMTDYHKEREQQNSDYARI